MSKKYGIILLVWMFFGCHNSAEQPASSLDRVADSLGIALPGELDTLENVSVVSPDQPPQYRIEFQRDQEYLAPNNSRFRTDDGIKIDDNGGVYIMDGFYIHAYEPDGTYRTLTGGSGKGPGEHSGFGGNQMIMQGTSLLTHDHHLQRINRFALEPLESTGAIIMDPGEWEGLGTEKLIFPGTSLSRKSNYYPLSDSLLLLRFSETVPVGEWTRAETEKFFLHYIKCQYYAMDLEGNIRSELLMEHECPVQVSGPMIGSELLPIYSRPILESPGNGKIYLTMSDQVLIHIHQSDGTYLKSLFLPQRNAEVVEEELIQSYTGFLKQSDEYLRNSDLPEKWPALKYFLVDDQERIWAATITDDEEEFEWRVVDEEGSLLAEFTWPGRRVQPVHDSPIRAIKNGYIYTYEEKSGDEMNLSQGRFVRYRYTLNSQ